MNWKAFFRVILIFFALIFLAPFVEGANSSGANSVGVVDLRCELKRNPDGIDVASPRLSWKMNSKSYGASQQAYRVWISASKNPVADPKFLIWDSGKVVSDAMFVDLPKNLKLKSETRYWWNVQLWDEKQQMSSASFPETFLTGKIRQEDWRGEWIGPDLFFEEQPGDAEGFLCVKTKQEDPCFIVIDLEKSFPIDKISVHPKRFKTWSYGDWEDGWMFPYRFSIDIADQDSFQQSDQVFSTGNKDIPNPGWKQFIYPVERKTGRYVRFVFDTLNPRWKGAPLYGALGEIEVFSGDKNVALGATVKVVGGRPVSGKGPIEGKGWSAVFLTDGKALAPKDDVEKKTIESKRHDHGAIYLRKEFSVEKPIQQAILSFSGLGYSECFINNMKVGDYMIGPGWTQYNKRVPYLTFDVTDRFMTMGKNSIDVILAGGWYSLGGDPWGGFEILTRYYMDIPKLRLDLRLVHTDGSETNIVSDKNWKWSRGEIVHSGVANEHIDLRKAGEKNRDWKSVVKVAAPAGLLEHQKEAFNRVIDRVKPIKVDYDPNAKRATFDFGREINGLVEFKTKGEEGQLILISTIPKDKGLGRTNRFWLSGTGEKEIYSPRFYYVAASHVTVQGVTDKPEIDDLVIRNITSQVTSTSDFKCSDEYLTWLHEAVRRTMVNYTTFLPNDPTREFKGWVQDCLGTSRAYMYMFDESKPMFSRWVDDMIHSQRDDGNVANIAPGAGFSPNNDYNSPWWGGMSIWMPWTYRVYTGDDRLIRSHYSPMKKYFEYLEKMAQKSGGLQDWGLLDWLPVEETPREIINTPAYYAYANMMSSCALLIGNKDDSQYFKDKAIEIKKRFNDAFLDVDTGIYGKVGWKTAIRKLKVPVSESKIHNEWWTGDRPCTQASQLLPLALGLAPDDSNIKDKVIQALISEIKAHNDHLSTGFNSTPHLLDYLPNVDPELCYKIVTQKDYPSWYSMTKGAGNDLLMETWDGGLAMMPALGGSIGHWFYESLGGIRPDVNSPGFKKISIKPSIVNGLDWVECSYESPYGKIVSNWRKNSKQMIMEVTIPPNTTATVVVPHKNRPVIEGITGKLPDHLKISMIEGSETSTIWAIPSGQYRFTVDVGVK